jgi:hypothetical protein
VLLQAAARQLTLNFSQGLILHYVTALSTLTPAKQQSYLSYPKHKLKHQLQQVLLQRGYCVQPPG